MSRTWVQKTSNDFIDKGCEEVPVFSTFSVPQFYKVGHELESHVVSVVVIGKGPRGQIITFSVADQDEEV